MATESGSLHKLSKDLLSHHYKDSAGSVESLRNNMYTTGGLSTRMTESPPQAQQGFAEPTLELMYNLVTQNRLLSLAHTPHSSEFQREEIAETGSPHTAQGLS